MALLAMISVVGIGVLAGYALGASDENRETIREAIDDQSGRIYVLEYDYKTLCSQLVAKEIIDTCH